MLEGLAKRLPTKWNSLSQWKVRKYSMNREALDSKRPTDGCAWCMVRLQDIWQKSIRNDGSTESIEDKEARINKHRLRSPSFLHRLNLTERSSTKDSHEPLQLNIDNRLIQLGLWAWLLRQLVVAFTKATLHSSFQFRLFKKIPYLGYYNITHLTRSLSFRTFSFAALNRLLCEQLLPAVSQAALVKTSSPFRVLYTYTSNKTN